MTILFWCYCDILKGGQGLDDSEGAERHQIFIDQFYYGNIRKAWKQ